MAAVTRHAPATERWQTQADDMIYKAHGILGRFLELQVSGFEPRRILDIGGNVGQFAAICHGVWPAAHITSIEGNENCRQRLEANADETHIALLSDSERDATFWTHDRNEVSQGCSYYRETLNCFPHTVPIQMRTTTLEKLLFGCEPYELVKLDTQGSELDIIRGGREIVRAAQYVLCEMQCETPSNEGAPSRAEVEAELASLGFGDGILLEWWNDGDRRVNEDFIYTKVKCRGANFVFGQPCENPAADPHTCPFESEIHGDDTTLCNCCETCETGCRYDI